ncbi:MAG: imidazole glycerol phosphate synthase subunit HisH [Anaerovoracaceae bacterium]|jgi:glutamine amidotransferase
MVGVIDYDAGNVKSVMKAVEKLGAKPVLTSDRKVLDECSSLILPGVGAFGKAVENLRARNLDTYIKEACGKGRLMLGICLGLQMLFDKSYEDGEWEGLGLIPGDIVRFGKESDENWDDRLKIPHMGWNELVINRSDRICEGVGPGEYAYFVHSYYARPADWNDVVLYADYSVKVPGVVRKGNVIGMQFHPEKSSTTGMKLLKNFLKEGENIAD